MSVTRVRREGNGSGKCCGWLGPRSKFGGRKVRAVTVMRSCWGAGNIPGRIYPDSPRLKPLLCAAEYRALKRAATPKNDLDKTLGRSPSVTQIPSTGSGCYSENDVGRILGRLSFRDPNTFHWKRAATPKTMWAESLDGSPSVTRMPSAEGGRRRRKTIWASAEAILAEETRFSVVPIWVGSASFGVRRLGLFSL